MIPETTGAANFSWFCRSIMAGKKDGTAGAASNFAERFRAPDRVLRILKDVPAITGENFANNVSADYATMINQFTDSLRTRSVFFRLLEPGGFTRVPLFTRVGVVTAGETGSARAPGAALPVHQLTLSGQMLSQVKAGATSFAVTSCCSP
jgi:hypothetical protein